MLKCAPLSVTGVANTQETRVFNAFFFLTQTYHELLKPHAFTVRQNVQICMTERVLIKGFNQSLSCPASVPLMSGREVGC